jgi:chromosome transmission fidelity protein 1
MAEERQIVGQLEQEVNETSSSGKKSAMEDDTDDDWIGALIAGTSTEVVNSSSFVKSSGRHTAFDAYKSMVDRVKHVKALSYSTGCTATHHGFNNSLSKDGLSGVMSTSHPAPKSRFESEWLEELCDVSELAAASSSSSSSISDIAAASSPDDIFLLAHYEATNPSSGHKDRGAEGLDDDEDDGLTGGPINISQALGLPQIYYCSRTHSQIAQFISEIRRTSHHSIRCVTLGSRKNMCVHPELSKLSSEAALTEACLELQKQKSVVGTTTSTKKEEEAAHYSSSIEYKRKAKKIKTQCPVKKEKCPYHKASREHQLADRLLASVCDLEDLVAFGEGEYSACPYYASRKAVHNSQVVCMPYSVLLHKDIREAVGLDDVRGKVIIFDEAHNVMEAINQLYSAELSGAQVQLAGSSLSMYRSRFQSKLTGENFYYISVLVEVVKKLASTILRASKAASCSSSSSSSSSSLSSSSSSSSSSTSTCSEVAYGNGRENMVNRNSVETIGGTSSTTTMTINDFLFSAGLDKVNLYQLKRYMVTTNLVNKVGGFAQSVSAAITNEATFKTDVIYALRCVLDLLVCLTNAEVDGRIFMLNNSSSCQSTALVGSTVIKYVMLNPSLHFLPLLSARSVIFVGGTLQPLSYFTSLLLPTVGR